MRESEPPKPAAGAAETGTLTQWPSPTAADSAVPTTWPTALAAEPEPAATGRGAKAAGAIACLLAAGALVTASFDETTWLTRLLGLAGLVVAVPGTVAGLGHRLGVLAVPAAGAILSTGILTASLTFPGLLGHRYESSRQSSSYEPSAIRAIPFGMGEGADVSIQVDGWTDASRAAIEQGTIRVRVTGVSVGPVELAGKQKAYTRERYLAVRLRLQHLGHAGPVTYSRWTGTGPRPRLTRGAQGFDPIELGSREVAGQARAGLSLHPGRSIEDVLIFEASGVNEPLRLALPAGAWGGQGSFQFHIPVSMISVRAGLGRG